MARTFYDSGWVPVASGTIRAVLQTEDYQVLHIFFGASGTNGASGCGGQWIVGADSQIPRPAAPWSSPRVEYGMLPKLTGVIAGISNPSANSTTDYIMAAVPTSGALATVLPQAIALSATAGSASWARIVVECN